MRERWNSENLCKKDSDEYKWLTEIDFLKVQAQKLTDTIESIRDSQNFEIQKEEFKSIGDFTEVRNKLIELQNIVDEL